MKTVLENFGHIAFSCTTFILGGLDSLLWIFIVVLIIDYITGILKAIYQRNLNSKIGLKGFIKKIGYIFIVVLSVFADRLLNTQNAIRTLVLYFFISNEALSILENWGIMGLPLPKALIKAFEGLKNIDKGSDTADEK